MAHESGGNIYLSKSLFMKGLQCQKALYLQKYRPEAKDELTKEKEKLFSAGYEVGRLAQDLFPGGIEVPYEGLSHAEQLDLTQSLIKQGLNSIYEATFNHDGVFVKVDLLHRGKDGWEIYEVKNSTSKKEYHVDDIAVQYYAVAGTGLPVSRAFLVHINGRYVRQGEIEVDKLFSTVDLTDTIRDKQGYVSDELGKLRLMLQGREPVIDIGRQCTTPYECDFRGYCWSHIPSPSVFDLAGLNKSKAFSLYRQGIVKLEDVPPDALGLGQKLQLEGTLYQRNHVDAAAVKAFIDELWYPLCFMDFETAAMIPIPMYDGIRPYQQLPFQYSVHVIDEAGGPLWHHEFIADGARNPQGEFLYRLLAVVTRDACVLVWNQTLEVPVLKELAAAFPEKKDDIFKIIGNTRDLMVPFRNKSIYHWKFNGSHSIKAVLPALVPELSYENLEISEGGMALTAWLRMILSNDPMEKSMLRQQLLQYCHLDSLAMVRILEKMKDMAG